MEGDILNMVDGKYTTCDEHDHPHFYIQMTKAKVRPKKNIVTGPVYLVIEDVPLYPLGLPFCFFPFTNSNYASGVIMPTFGDESARGFFLRDGGYYFALSDYIDLAVTGEIYTKGSWGLAARSTYRKRYKFSGNFNASYLVTRLGDKDLPDYSLSKDFKINWTHTQDAKANPFQTFSASVNFSTSSYDRNNVTGYYSPSSTNNTKSSSISYSRRFPNSPFNISATMNVNQRTRDSAISVTLPDISVTMSRIYPFKRKSAIGAERWYEKISLSYSGYLRNSIDTKENMLFKSNLIKDWQNAMKHTAQTTTTFNLFKNIQITPSIDYNEYWYTSKIEQEYDIRKQQLVARDTTYGFYRVFNYSTSVSASTTLYGFFKPLPFLGNKVEMIRHRFTPSVSISYAPDFGSSRFGYYKDYRYTNQYGEDVVASYSPFSHQMYGVPGKGKTGNVSFSVDNNLEMKIKSNSDSTGFKKISLIDKLALNMSYNLAADSFQWSDLGASLRMKFSKSYTLQLSGSFDTYTYGYDQETGRVYRVNVPRWKAGKGIGRLRGTQTSFSYTFNNDTFKKLFGGKTDDSKTGDNANADPNTENPENLDSENNDLENNGGDRQGGGRLLGKKKEVGETDADGYLVANVPWSLSFGYSMGLSYGDFDPKKLEYKYKLTHSLSFNGSIQPTKNWRINFNGTFDFDTKKISYLTCNITRDLHCFQMTASLIPVGPFKSYTFSIAVSSSLLKDLKYNQSNNSRGSSMNWY